MVYFVEFTSGDKSERIAETPDIDSYRNGRDKTKGIQSGGKTRNNIRI